MTSPRNQAQYQVRFDWGLAGAGAISRGAHIVVWVDALSVGRTADPTALLHGGAIVEGTVGNAAATARWVLDRQVEIGDRAVVAVVAAGSDATRFAVEDLLAAGAVIDALGDVGIDYLSPEAAVAAAAFTALRNATWHLLSASVTGQELIALHGREAVDAARTANSQPQVRILREFRPPA